MILNVIYVASFIHIAVTYFETDLKSVPIPDENLSRALWVGTAIVDYKIYKLF